VAGSEFSQPDVTRRLPKPLQGRTLAASSFLWQRELKLYLELLQEHQLLARSMNYDQELFSWMLQLQPGM
jgi:hypothetical protein